MSEDSADVDTDDGDDEDHSEAQAALAAAANADKSDSDDAARRVAELERELNEWKSHARKHEDNFKKVSSQLRTSKSDKDRLAELEQAVNAANEDRLNERKFNALTQVQLRLAEAGIRSEDVASILEGYDASALLEGGKPNNAAIERLAKSLIKVAGRSTPDPDQGRRGGDGPVDMNTLIRRAAGVIT